MGIKDLLPTLKSIQKPRNVSDYKGLTVAVDGYCWYAHSSHSLLGCTKGPTPVLWTWRTAAGSTSKSNRLNMCRLISYCNTKLQMMMQAGVKPIIIFDGCRLDMKSNTEAERRK